MADPNSQPRSALLSTSENESIADSFYFQTDDESVPQLNKTEAKASNYFSPVNMIGRLLHLGSGGQAANASQDQVSGSTPRPILSLDSVQEDIHTRNLLFPDATALYQHRNDQVFPLSNASSAPISSSAAVYDYGEEVDLDVKDVRVLIMQDTLGPSNASLLYDSHPVHDLERSSSFSENKKGPPSRKSSQSQSSRPLTIHSDNTQPRHGAFDRRLSMHSRNQSHAETEPQRAAREYREELATFSSCIFGNSELMAYKGTSTKVHVVPSDNRSYDAMASVVGDGRSSLGRSSMRSSKLSQSYTSQTVSPTYGPVLSGMSTPHRQSGRKKVLITRLFPVTLTAEDVEPRTSPQDGFSEENTGFPFPAAGDEAPRKKPQPKQRRTPMYAVVLVVHLPPTSSRISSAAPNRSAFRESGSYNEQDLFSSSYNSTKGAGWNMNSSGMYGDASDSPFSWEVEDRIDPLTKHWDVIMRTLTHLQSLAASKIHRMLKRADAASPGTHSSSTPTSRASSVNERRSAEYARIKPPKSTTKLVSLWPNCLADDAGIAAEVGSARSRIVMGVSVARVATGQGRWGIWRDEAIWAAKWTSSMDKGPFLYNLLTGFLATHTDWLQALCSPSYKRKIAIQMQKKNEDDMALPARTIIISDDKMAARRLIFLLSAFLPSNQQINAPRAHRPSISASIGPYSNSPPTYIVPVLREESLRRKINRRSGLRRASHSKIGSQSARNSVVPTNLPQLGIERGHQRRASDAASIRTLNLPMPGGDFVSRKSSAATTTTVVPESTVPHFTTLQRSDTLLRYRAGGPASAATEDLKRSLQRGESNTSISSNSSRSTSQGLKWGNLVSGLWSPKRRGSNDSSSQSQFSDPRSPVKQTFSNNDQLSQMVQQISLTEEPGDDLLSCSPRQTTLDRGATTPQRGSNRGRFSFSQQDRTPDPTGAFESPVKTSINADDGVIDVDIPFPDYIASFESAISSPSSSGYLSTPGLPSIDAFEQSTRVFVDGDNPINAAGWLNRFHPDFALQAIPPQSNLMDKVKAALRAEPTPQAPHGAAEGQLERWVDVGSVVIADTTTNTITRIIYRRLVKTKGTDDRPGIPNIPAHGSNILTPSIVPYETQLDEEWIEEQITESDDTLVEALEKILYRTPETSKVTSSASSHSQPESRDSISVGTPDTLSEITQLADAPADIPRVQCKAIVLSALEEVIRDVVETRDDNGDAQANRHGRHPNLLRDSVRQWVNDLEAVA